MFFSYRKGKRAKMGKLPTSNALAEIRGHLDTNVMPRFVLWFSPTSSQYVTGSLTTCHLNTFSLWLLPLPSRERWHGCNSPVATEGVWFSPTPQFTFCSPTFKPPITPFSHYSYQKDERANHGNFTNKITLFPLASRIFKQVPTHSDGGIAQSV